MCPSNEFIRATIASGATPPLQSFVPKWMVIRSGGVREVARDLLRMLSIVLICQPGWPSCFNHCRGTYLPRPAKTYTPSDGESDG